MTALSGSIMAIDPQSLSIVAIGSCVISFTLVTALIRNPAVQALAPETAGCR